MAPLNQLRETAMAAASKGVEGSSLAGLAKGKTASSELRDKKTDDASSSDQADGSAATATPFAAKISDAMAGLPRTTETAHVALDTSALQQSPQIAQGDAGGHLAGQSSVGQDGKASTGAATDASAPAAQFPAPGDAMPGVSSAHLVQSVNSSEMRLGMQSAEFGNISISTSLNHQALSAQISIDHSELGRALAVHLPAIEEKLGTAYGVQAKVELRDSNTPSQSGDSGYSNAGQQSKDQRQSQGGAAQGSTASVFAPETNYTRTNAFTNSTASSAASLSRLDIRV
jgi:hypothetical protein